MGDALNPFRSADQAATQASLNHAALHALTGGVAVIETDRAHEDPTSAIAWIETAGVPKRLVVDGGLIRAVYPSRNQCVR